MVQNRAFIYYLINHSASFKHPAAKCQVEGGSLYLRVKLKQSVAAIDGISQKSNKGTELSVTFPMLNKESEGISTTNPTAKPPIKLTENEPVCLPMEPTR